MELKDRLAILNCSPGSLRHVVEVTRIDGRLIGTFSSATYYLVGEEFRFAGRGEYMNQLNRSGDSKWRISRRRHRFFTPHIFGQAS